MQGNRDRRSWFSAWIPFGLWLAVLFGLSSIPDFGPPGGDLPFVDKIGHLGLYGILGTLWARARGTRGRSANLIAAVLGAVIGILDETYQSTVPGREVDAFDVVADTLGAMLGAMLWVRLPWATRRTDS